MPKLDGLKFVQIIRSIDRYEDTPIIMITSEAAKYNVVDAISAGDFTLNVSLRDAE